jgi:hypothetical protein
MIKTLLLSACLMLATGCVSYTEKPDGTIRFVSFLKKAELTGAEVGQLKIKGANTSGDAELLKAAAEGAVQGAIKGVGK